MILNPEISRPINRGRGRLYSCPNQTSTPPRRPPLFWPHSIIVYRGFNIVVISCRSSKRFGLYWCSGLLAYWLGWGHLGCKQWSRVHTNTARAAAEYEKQSHGNRQQYRSRYVRVTTGFGTRCSSVFKSQTPRKIINKYSNMASVVGGFTDNNLFGTG